jgi:hypothetical protein
MPLPTTFAVNTACAFNANRRSRIWQRPYGISKNARNTLRNKSTATIAMLKWLWQPCSEENRTRPPFVRQHKINTDAHQGRSESSCHLLSNISTSETFKSQARRLSLAHSSIVHKTYMRGAYSCQSTNTPRDNLTRSISSFPQINLACSPSRCSIMHWGLQIVWQMRMSDSKIFYRLNTKTEHHSPYSAGRPNLISISFCIRLIRSECTIMVLYMLLNLFIFQVLCMNTSCCHIMYRLRVA